MKKPSPLAAMPAIALAVAAPALARTGPASDIRGLFRGPGARGGGSRRRVRASLPDLEGVGAVRHCASTRKGPGCGGLRLLTEGLRRVGRVRWYRVEREVW